METREHSIRATKNDRLLIEAFMGYCELDLPSVLTWNDIMPVVEKIPTLINGSWFTIYCQNGLYESTVDTENNRSDKSLVYIQSNKSSIDATYQAVINFILWYNKQADSESTTNDKTLKD